MESARPDSRAATGVEGLDRILGGGLPRDHMYLIEGGPGTGKTTLCTQFLLAGQQAGEKCLYLTLLQTREELLEAARSHGWDLGGVVIEEVPTSCTERAGQEQTIFHASDVELSELLEAVRAALERHQPDRVVFDSLDEIRLLADTPSQYQRQALLIKKALCSGRRTSMVTSCEPGEDGAGIYALVHGALRLMQSPPVYGNVRRQLLVTKMRGVNHQGGHHDCRIRTGGLEVYPRLDPGVDPHQPLGRTFSSGVPGLDGLLGGGLEPGTACLLMGQSGTGKSSMISLYVHAAAVRGERSAIWTFDERADTLLTRARGLGLDLKPYIEQGLVQVEHIDVGELSPGEFAHRVRRAVIEDGVRLVAIDSLSGYINAMPEERSLILQLHELLTYLSGQSVLTMMVVTQHGIFGNERTEGIDISYMADTVLLIRRFESRGMVRMAMSVVKKRQGGHEKTIRELRLTSEGLQMGEPLREFQGVLSGLPAFLGGHEELLGSREGGR